ncbi:MAG: hypothetical protein AAFQ65_11345 [Myxococcota bacterium]
MKNKAKSCIYTWLILASLIGFYGCSGEDDPSSTPGEMSDSSDDSGDGPNGGDGDGEPDPAGIAQGDPCTEDGQACAAGLTCVEGVCCNEACDGVCQSCRGDISGGFDGTCTSLPAGDERIIEAEDYEDCPGVQTCDGNGACFARAAGEACDSDGQCGSGFCTDGVCCNARCAGTCESCSTGTCSTVTTGTDPGTCESQCTADGCTGVAIGESCQSDVDCGSGICDEVCVLADGNVCGANSECLSTCISGMCQAPSEIGLTCDGDDDIDCQDGLTCVGSTCVIPIGSSSPCSSASQCEEPLCLDGLCAPLIAEGESCSSDDQCAEPNDNVCRGECVDATGQTCTGSCPGARTCDLEREYEDNNYCYSRSDSVLVTPYVGKLNRPNTLSTEVSCLNPEGVVVSSIATLTGSSAIETGSAEGPRIECAVGSVVHVECSGVGIGLLVGPGGRPEVVGSLVGPWERIGSGFNHLAERTGGVLCYVITD